MYDEAGQDDLITIFAKSVILYKKQPVFVDIVNRRSLICKDIEDLTTPPKEFDIDDPNFDFTPVPLGFCNYKKNAYYLQRIPKRQYKQGLESNSLVCGKLESNEDVGTSPRNILMSRSLSHCIKGSYPSLNTALRCVLEEDYISVAFSRVLAVDCDLNLYFRRKQVGMVSENGAMIFKKSMKYLERIIYASDFAK